MKGSFLLILAFLVASGFAQDGGFIHTTIGESTLPSTFDAKSCSKLTEDDISSISPATFSTLNASCLSQLDFACGGVTEELFRGANGFLTETILFTPFSNIFYSALTPDVFPALRPFCLVNIRTSSWRALRKEHVEKMTLEQCTEFAWHFTEAPADAFRGVNYPCFASWRQGTTNIRFSPRYVYC